MLDQRGLIKTEGRCTKKIGYTKGFWQPTCRSFQWKTLSRGQWGKRQNKKGVKRYKSTYVTRRDGVSEPWNNVNEPYEKGWETGREMGQ